MRDLIYINGTAKCFYSYGIEFHEFIKALEHQPEVLVLLKHKFEDALWHQKTRLEYITSSELDLLIQEDIYGYGDFSWVDFTHIDELNHLEKEQIAELLFFGHMAEPVKETPKHRFAYWAHDDGFFNKLYVSNTEDYQHLIANAIIYKFKRLTNQGFNPISKEIAIKIFNLTTKGLLIDFTKIESSLYQYTLPIFTIGHFISMSEMYEHKELVNEVSHKLIYCDSTWSFI